MREKGQGQGFALKNSSKNSSYGQFYTTISNLNDNCVIIFILNETILFNRMTT